MTLNLKGHTLTDEYRFTSTKNNHNQKKQFQIKLLFYKENISKQFKVTILMFNPSKKKII